MCTGSDFVEAPAVSVATALKVYAPAVTLDHVDDVITMFGQYSGGGQIDRTKVPKPRLLVPSKNSTFRS